MPIVLLPYIVGALGGVVGGTLLFNMTEKPLQVTTEPQLFTSEKMLVAAASVIAVMFAYRKLK